MSNRESGAILEYLADKYHELIPLDPTLRVECLKWLFWGSASISTKVKAFGFYYKYCPHKLPYIIERQAKEVNRLLSVLDSHLEAHGKHWIVGGQSNLLYFAPLTIHFFHSPSSSLNRYYSTHTEDNSNTTLM